MGMIIAHVISTSTDGQRIQTLFCYLEILLCSLEIISVFCLPFQYCVYLTLQGNRERSHFYWMTVSNEWAINCLS